MNTTVQNKRMEKGGVQGLAWMLILIFSLGLISQTKSIAGGGGPTQPEVQGFTPIGMSDMVDPFTGDFTYNIPLMDVEGYPINIAYNSGISMDQEASWVGLGWNLNVGSILRSMRGLPDDFNGDTIVKTRTSKPQNDLSLSVNASGFEIFGKDLKENIEDYREEHDLNPSEETPGNVVDSLKNLYNYMSFSGGIAISYNNYSGWGANLDLGASYSLKRNGKTSDFGLNMSGSSENGAGFSPSFSRSKSDKRTESKDYTITNSFSSGFNSRGGLTSVSFGRTLSKALDKNNSIRYNTMGSSYNTGLRNYSPSSNPRYISSNCAGSVTTSLSLFGADGQVEFGFTLNRSQIDPAYILLESPAFGFFHLNEGQQNKKALLDFNRDNDGQFNQYTPYLPSAFLTSDLFSIQAQGISGSYRGYRNEIGYVFDPVSETRSSSGSFGYEFGLGNTSDISLDISGSIVNGYAGPWVGGSNDAAEIIKFETANGILENFALQEAGERSVDTDSLFGNVFSKTNPENLTLSGIPRYTKVNDDLASGSITSNNRENRIKRNQLMSILTIREVNLGLGLDNPNSNLYNDAPEHHIGEITQIGTDGRRYVFGLPAYNTTQEDATFAVGDELGNDTEGIFPTSNHYNGLVDLGDDFDAAASTSNSWGIDHFYSSQKTPAYAHSFLLTAVLSDDYVDSDQEKGPSENDLGTYVKVDYQKVANVKWRTPMLGNSAYYNEGLKSDKKDDKASFVFGEKELYYVSKIETKNYVAVFFCGPRMDGNSAADRSGDFDPSAGKMLCLNKICLYTKKEFDAHQSDLTNAKALQEVHFKYNYSLCPGYPANLTGGGKLTLEEIYFVYQGSYKLKRSSYKFQYNGGNAHYNIKAVDRWGTYQATGSGQYNLMDESDPIPNGDFPYTCQNKTTADANAAQWNLTDIFLPSGGRIQVDYESDDYAYVQNVRASQMFPIVATGDINGAMNSVSNINGINIQPLSKLDNKNRALFFKLKPGYTNISAYGTVGQLIYFKCLVNMDKNPDSTYADWEYVSGYAVIKSITAQGSYGKIELQDEKLLDNGGSDYNPITKTAIQFARMNLSRTINDIDINGADNNSEAGIMNSIAAIGSSITSFGELITGPNLAIYNKDKCQDILTNRSFIRLFEPSKHKLGGGSRVKKIKMYDHWKEMANNTGTPSSANFTYGQEFIYELEDGTSSGVATYEPAIGGDENSMVTARIYSEKVKFAPDNDMFFEIPLMESQFPNPSVGYSRVVIKDLKPSGISNSGTGKVIKEFYTAKDFPVIVKASDLDYKQSSSFLPFLPKYEFMTATQGFYIELNDMHGKPKSEAVYGENKPMPISTVQYDYLKEDVVVNGASGFKLMNEVTTIKNDGTSQQAEIGVKYEAVADFRETTTESYGVGPIELNTNSFFAGPLFLVIPTIWGKIDIAEDRFRSATLNKVVNKFGILNRVTANQDGSIVETKNLAYDAETGEVLATQTVNNFNDAVYSLNYPAHWKYENLGMAYKNIGYSISGYPIYADGFVPVGALSSNFVEGDEVIVTKVQGANPSLNGWVTEVTPNGIRILDKAGDPIAANIATIKVIRSGRRNKQSSSMATISSNNNPISGLTSEIFTNVLNAGVVEYSEDWSTFCDCFREGENSNPTKNPYVNGTNGNWRPVKSYTYLTDRTQTNTNNNTNIRRDGVFSSFSPYYFRYNNQWMVNPSNWTFVSEVTEFSPNGQTLETRDALGRYSSSLMGYRNTLTSAVVSNSKLNQVAEGSFEDVDYLNCMDQSIFAKVNPNYVSTDQSHSGRTSIHVVQNTSVIFNEVQQECNNNTTCSLGLTPLSSNTYQIQGAFNASNSTVISGSGSMSIAGNILTISYSNTSYFEMIVEISDSESKCRMKVKFFNTPGNLNTLNMQIINVIQY